MSTASIVSESTSAAYKEVEQSWALRTLPRRLAVIHAARHLLARDASRLVDSIPANLHRTRADSYASEVLPLLEACKFIEREAATILKPRRLGRRGLPFWLAGIESHVERVPLGRVLVIAPSNYPLFLAGVQTLQALAAGNHVVWKPGLGGAPVAEVFAVLLREAGLPEGVLRVTGESAETGAAEVNSGPDQIVFTGSQAAGRAVASSAAAFGIPLIAELSGCDAVIVLPSADPARVVDALAFGMRLNGSATCMAPRRLMLIGDGYDPLLDALAKRFAETPGITLAPATREHLQTLIAEAEQLGAVPVGDASAPSFRPLLLLNGRPEMRIAQSDIFAPVLTVLHLPDAQAAIHADKSCPYGLTAAIFGEEPAARTLGAKLCVGTVLINDLIVPTADPRVPFGGRRASGFGVTRGAEGLLAMTASKTTLVRRGKSRRHLAPTTDKHEALFAGVVSMSHSAGWRQRFQGLRATLAAATKLGEKQ